MIVELTEAQLDDLADRIAARLTAPAPVAQLVDAAQMARILGVERSTVYEHADELGALRLGQRGEGNHGGPRLRFDPQTALEAWTSRSRSERSDASTINGSGPSVPATTRSRRRLPNGLPKPGVEPGVVLPVRPAPNGRRRSSAISQPSKGNVR